MSNLIINIRFWYWHLQIEEKFSGVKIKRNNSIDTLKDIPKIEILKFF